MRDALEANLVAHPDDPAGHAAYADYLIEQGDPRGEFVRVQLALEDESLSKEERDKLRSREKELLAAHEREWLGDLAVPALGEPPLPPLPPPEVKTWLGRVAKRVFQPRPPVTPDVALGWRRGWLHRLDVGYVGDEFWNHLYHSPNARLLREIKCCSPVPIESTLNPEPAEGFANVNRIVFGEAEISSIFQNEAIWFDGHFPRLEELQLYVRNLPALTLVEQRHLTALRRLTYWHDHHYPLHRLAANPNFANLELLSCFPHTYDPREDRRIQGTERGSYLPLDEVAPLFRSPHLGKLTHLALRESNMGDDGVRVLVESGMLARLRVLDLSHGAITDSGADLLARHGRHLEALNLSDNALTPASVRALREANVPVTADDQHAAGDDRYLYAGEFE